MSVYKYIRNKLDKGHKLFAVLIDPEDIEFDSLIRLVDYAQQAGVDLFLIGGSKVSNDLIREIIKHIKEYTKIPCMIFPGDVSQIEESADALMFLSLISGRNPEYLISKHVEAAASIRKMDLEVIPTAYLLIDGGKISSVQYVSQTLPIPRDKTELAISTAIAGELLGMKMVYLEAGSGAELQVPYEMIQEVKNAISQPLFVGGGIRTREQAELALKAGADIIVIGNAFEKDPESIFDISSSIHTQDQNQV